MGAMVPTDGGMVWDPNAPDPAPAPAPDPAPAPAPAPDPAPAPAPIASKVDLASNTDLASLVKDFYNNITGMTYNDIDQAQKKLDGYGLTSDVINNITGGNFWVNSHSGVPLDLKAVQNAVAPLQAQYNQNAAKSQDQLLQQFKSDVYNFYTDNPSNPYGTGYQGYANMVGKYAALGIDPGVLQNARDQVIIPRSDSGGLFGGLSNFVSGAIGGIGDAIGNTVSSVSDFAAKNPALAAAILAVATDGGSLLTEGALGEGAALGAGAEASAGTAAAEAAAADAAGGAGGAAAAGGAEAGAAGAASSGIPSSLITAAERNAAQQLLTTGKIDPTKLVTGVATGAATGALGNEINANLPDNIDPSVAKYVAPAAIAAATGKDPLKAIEGTAAGDALNAVPGFSDLPIEAKNAAATAVMSGGDPRAIVNSLKKSAAGDIVDSVTASQANATNTPTEDQVNQSNADFVKSLEPYKATPPPADDGTTAGINDTIQQLQDAGLKEASDTAVAQTPTAEEQASSNQDVIQQLVDSGATETPTQPPAPVAEEPKKEEPAPVVEEPAPADDGTTAGINDTIQQLQDSGLVNPSEGAAWDAATSDPNYGGEQTPDERLQEASDTANAQTPTAEEQAAANQDVIDQLQNDTTSGGTGGNGGGPTKPVTPTVTPKPVTPTPKPTTPTPTPAPVATGGTDVNTLLALLGAMGGQQQAAAPVQDPYAHIKSYKDIFGHEFADDGVFAKTEQNTAKAATGGSVDDLLKLLGI